MVIAGTDSNLPDPGAIGVMGGSCPSWAYGTAAWVWVMAESRYGLGICLRWYGTGPLYWADTGTR